MFSIIRFTAPDGEVITREGNTGSGIKPVVGDTSVIYYDSKRGSLSNFNFASIALLAAGTVMIFAPLALLTFGTMRYALGYGMTGFWHFFQKFITLFFLPLVMISFDAAMIYGMIFNGPHPRWIYALLGIFIFTLTLAIMGYLKMIIKKSLPKWQRTGNNEWSAD